MPCETLTVPGRVRLSMIMTAKKESLDDFAKLRRSPHAMASWKNAQQYLNNGRHAPALTSSRNLVQQYPGAAQLWAELGTAAAGNLDFASADQALQRAMASVTADADLLVSI